MFYVLGAGAAQPTGSISNALLTRCSSAFDPVWLKDFGLATRASVLPEEYILQTGNSDPAQAQKAALCSPTDLSYLAAQRALERAGIGAEQIGLVIGAGETPLETTPSEGQRVAGRFGLKVPAFDIVGGVESALLHLDIFSRWKSEALPDYVLLVYASCPTMRVNYKQGREGAIFADAAGALLVSPRIRGKLSLKNSSVYRSTQVARMLTVGTYTNISVDFAVLDEIAPAAHAEVLASGLKSISSPRNLLCLVPQYSTRFSAALERVAGLPAGAFGRAGKSQGCCLGASFAVGLSDAWGELRAGQDIMLCSAAAGPNNAWVHLGVE